MIPKFTELVSINTNHPDPRFHYRLGWVVERRNLSIYVQVPGIGCTWCSEPTYTHFQGDIYLYEETMYLSMSQIESLVWEEPPTGNRTVYLIRPGMTAPMGFAIATPGGRLLYEEVL